MKVLLDRPEPPATGLRFLPDGDTLVVARGRGLELWDVHSAARTAELPLPNGGRSLHAWEIAPDGRAILVSREYGGSYLLDLSGDVRCKLVLPPPAAAYLAVKPPSLGSDVAILHEDGVREDRGRSFAAYSVACEFAFGPDGQAAVAAYGQEYAVVWDLHSGQPRAMIGGAVDGARIARVAWSADGRFVLTADDRLRLRMWEADSAREAWRCQLGAPGPASEAPGRAWPRGRLGLGPVRFSPSGDQFVAAVGTAVRRWELQTRTELPPLEGHSAGHPIMAGDPEPSAIHDLRFSACGARVLTVGIDATLRVWDTATGRTIWVGTPEPCCREAGDLSGDGDWVAWGGCCGMQLFRVIPE